MEKIIVLNLDLEQATLTDFFYYDKEIGWCFGFEDDNHQEYYARLETELVEVNTNYKESIVKFLQTKDKDKLEAISVCSFFNWLKLNPQQNER